MVLTKFKIATAVVLAQAALGVGLGGAVPTAPAQQPPGWELWRVLKGHADPVQCLSFGPNNVLLSGGKDGHVHVWDADAAKEVATFQNKPGGIRGINYAPDATWVAFRFDNGIALSFDKFIKDGKPVHIGPGIGQEGRAPLALAPDGMTYAWRTDGGKALEVSDLDLRREAIGEVKHRVVCEGHAEAVLCAAFTPDVVNLADLLVATGSADKTARIWDAFTGKEKFRLKGHADAVLAVEFSADGKTVATGGKDGTVKLWDVATGKERASLKGNAAVRCLAFAPDGKTLASAGDDKTVVLWDVAKGEERTRLKGHTDAVAAVRFNLDGSLLASAGADTTVRLWQVRK